MAHHGRGRNKPMLLFLCIGATLEVAAIPPSPSRVMPATTSGGILNFASYIDPMPKGSKLPLGMNKSNLLVPDCAAFDLCVQSGGALDQCCSAHKDNATRVCAICTKAACVLRADFCRSGEGAAPDAFCKICDGLAAVLEERAKHHKHASSWKELKAKPKSLKQKPKPLKQGSGASAKQYPAKPRNTGRAAPTQRPPNQRPPPKRNLQQGSRKPPPRSKPLGRSFAGAKAPPKNRAPPKARRPAPKPRRNAPAPAQRPVPKPKPRGRQMPATQPRGRNSAVPPKPKPGRPLRPGPPNQPARGAAAGRNTPARGRQPPPGKAAQGRPPRGRPGRVQHGQPGGWYRGKQEM